MYLSLNHKNLDVYQESIELLTHCNRITLMFPNDERFILTQQIRRAALSVVLNISEGASRKSSLERKRFYEIARGSIIEIDSAIEVALKLKYILPAQSDPTGKLIVSCCSKLSKMIQTLSNLK